MSSLKPRWGRRYGRLLVVERVGSGRDQRGLWRCVCDCGGERKVEADRLERGETKSCGCIRSERGRRATRGWGGQAYVLRLRALKQAREAESGS